MSEVEYLKERLENQIDWYSRKSSINKKWFLVFQTTTIIAASLVTLSGVFNFKGVLSYFSPALGALIAVLSGLIGLFKFQEKWLEYRTSSESLKHEKYLYLSKSNPYEQENCFKTLVQRVEGLISQENSKWSQYIQNSGSENEESIEKRT